MTGMVLDTGIPAPPPDCARCPRLAAMRAQNRAAYPDWHNGPVASFGPVDAPVLIVGLAPGLRGANRTGRPFTGDSAGDLLYSTLITHGFAQGSYGRAVDDGLRLTGCRIVNAVRCVPPQNKPVGAEIANCRPYLAGEIRGMKNLRALLALGRVAHEQVLRVFDLALKTRPFGHGRCHDLSPDGNGSGKGSGLLLFDSYHCSRYNTNTRRLTPEMFDVVVANLSQA